jgi:quercetin dioxygenase-like cupin family protein
MKLVDFPIAAINWASVAAVTQVGETGTATTRTRKLGEVQLRLIDYGAGYKADHWCSKGHILHVLAGHLIIEYENQSQTTLSPGTTWHAADGALPAHRVLSKSGASVLIVD